MHNAYTASRASEPECLQKVRQRVVAFVAGVFIERSGRSRQSQFPFPRRCERSWVVDFKLIQNRVGIEPAEVFDHMKIPIPSEHAAGIAVEAAGIVEIRRVHYERCAFPVSDGITEPQSYSLRQVR